MSARTRGFTIGNLRLERRAPISCVAVVGSSLSLGTKKKNKAPTKKKNKQRKLQFCELEYFGLVLLRCVWSEAESDRGLAGVCANRIVTISEMSAMPSDNCQRGNSLKLYA